MVRKNARRNWPRTDSSTPSSVSTRRSKKESSADGCDWAGSPGWGVNGFRNGSISLSSREHCGGNNILARDSPIRGGLHQAFAIFNYMEIIELRGTRGFLTAWCGFLKMSNENGFHFRPADCQAHRGIVDHPIGLRNSTPTR